MRKTPSQVLVQMFIRIGMIDGVETGKERQVVGQAGRDVMVLKGSGICEVVGQVE